MKSFIRVASSIFVLLVCAPAFIHGHDKPALLPLVQSPAPPAPRPTPDKATTPATAPSAAAAQPEQSTRERRVKAYAKLMEGQRFFTSARAAGNITREDLRAAQASLEQAATLDPTLSEAHTALAEIAFFFLDDQAQAERHAAAAVRVDNNNFGAHRILSRLAALKAGLDRDKLIRADADRAIAELKEVLRLDANDAEALALLGEFSAATGRDNEAIEAFTRWTGAPASIEGNFYKAFTQGRELSPDAAAARLAEALLKAGRTVEAVDAIRRALALSPDNNQYLALLGEAIDAGGDNNAGAITELQRMVAANPDNLAAISLLAHAEARAGKVDEAVKILRAGATERSGDSRELQQQRRRLTDDLAGVLAEALRYDEAINIYNELLKARGITDKLINADSDKEAARRNLQSILTLQRQAGRTADALATIERMRLLLGANDPRIEFFTVELLREQGKRREALEAARAARLKYPELPDFLRLEANALADLGQVEEGVTLLRTRLTGKLEDDYPTYLSIANLYLQAGRGKEAVEAARKLLALAPAEQPDLVSQALFMLSSAQERAGDPKGAEESLRRVLAKEPQNATALNNLGYFLTERGERLDEALDMIKRAVKSEPTNPNYLDSLGWAYFKLGQLEEAERHLNDAARRNLRSSAVQEHLGDLYLKRGQPEQARAAWSKALSLTVEAAESARLRAKISGETRK